MPKSSSLKSAFKGVEQSLLLHAMQFDNSQARPGLCKPDEKIQWDYLLDLAEAHGLLPLLYKYLHQPHQTFVPESILTELEHRYQANALRNRVLTQELLNILKLFEDNDIKALAYKGPSLTLSVYGDLGLRHFGDLDILIQEKDVLRACHILDDKGYSRTIPPLPMKKELDFIRTDHEHEFISHDELVHIDLHWQLSTRRFPIITESSKLFERSENIHYSGNIISHISAVDLLLLLCMHSNKDLWRKLVWLCDIDRLVRSLKNLDWDLLISQAVASHCERMLLLSLYICHEILETPLPQSIVERATQHELPKLGNQALNMSLQTGTPTRNFMQCLSIQPFIVSLCDTNRDKTLYISRSLITPTESDMTRYHLPALIHFVYYLITPARKLIFCTLRMIKRKFIS